ncbi:MAG: hypothetical protein K5773_08095 [Pseudobutyrivibrio sp.]|nr:hypothetical protein [Pseudobutyrivibrio sp.]
MIIIRALAFLLHFTLVPIALGRLITYRESNARANKYLANYLVGLFGSWAIFYLMFAILEWHQNWNTYEVPFTGVFTALTIVYSCVMGIIFLVWIIKDRKNILPFFAQCKTRLTGLFEKIRADRFLALYMILAAGLLLVQLYFAYAYEINEWSYDDYDYVVASMDTIDNDLLANSNIYTGQPQYMTEKRAAASWTTMVAYFSQVSGFEVTTICHTILPVVLLLVAYIAYYYMATLIFNRIDNRMIFMILLQLGFIFGNYSHYSVTFRLLGAIWQGKAILTAIAVPFILAYLLDSYSKEIRGSRTVAIAAISLGACSLTTMATPMIGLLAGAAYIVACIHKRGFASFRYLIASVFGPVFQAIFLMLITWLLEDMSGNWPKHFPNRGRDNSWWYKWFG